MKYKVEEGIFANDGAIQFPKWSWITQLYLIAVSSLEIQGGLHIRNSHLRKVPAWAGAFHCPRNEKGQPGGMPERLKHEIILERFPGIWWYFKANWGSCLVYWLRYLDCKHLSLLPSTAVTPREGPLHSSVYLFNIKIEEFRFLQCEAKQRRGSPVPVLLNWTSDSHCPGPVHLQ